MKIENYNELSTSEQMINLIFVNDKILNKIRFKLKVIFIIL